MIEDPRVRELMRLPYYDNKMRLVYYYVESPPTCRRCGREVADEVFIVDKSGTVWCIDHAPHLPGQRTLEAFMR